MLGLGLGLASPSPSPSPSPNPNQARREEEGRQRSATVIQATYRGKQDRARAAERAPKPREWRFAKSCVRSFSTQDGGYNSATFFVHRHEKLEI